jgi:protein-disulfide isomerase
LAWFCICRQAALAANKHGKYAVFHHALYEARGQVDETKVLEVAAAVGLDIDQMKTDMKGFCDQRRSGQEYEAW